MKLPKSVQTKSRKIVNGVKPTFAKAMLTAPKKPMQLLRATQPIIKQRIESCGENRLIYGS